MKIFSYGLIPILFLPCCLPQQPAEQVDIVLHLGIEFDSDDLLDVIVLETESQTCDSVYNANDPESLDRLDKKTASAQALNEGSVSFEFASLPAETELTFYAHAFRDGDGILARDCTDGVVIPTGNNVEVNLEFQ